MEKIDFEKGLIAYMCFHVMLVYFWILIGTELDGIYVNYRPGDRARRTKGNCAFNSLDRLFSTEKHFLSIWE